MTATRRRPGPALDPSEDRWRPLREALRARADAEAGAVLASARADADRVLDQARRTAGTATAEARRQGRVDAEAVLVAERAVARRSARGVVLAARREEWEELRARACDAVAELLDDDDVRRALEQRLRERLGPDTALSPSQDGGLLAEAGERRVDASVSALVDLVMRSTLDLDDPADDPARRGGGVS